jgi:hypothetical protein
MTLTVSSWKASIGCPSVGDFREPWISIGISAETAAIREAGGGATRGDAGDTCGDTDDSTGELTGDSAGRMVDDIATPVGRCVL